MSKNNMAAYNIGDEVIILRRKPGNTTGIMNYYKPNGDAGKKGYIKAVWTPLKYEVWEDAFTYLGAFDEDEIALTIAMPSPQLQRAQTLTTNFIQAQAIGQLLTTQLTGSNHMKGYKFKVGDRVVQKKDSPYYAQSGEVPGTIQQVTHLGMDYRVRWDNGNDNDYDEVQLKAYRKKVEIVSLNLDALNALILEDTVKKEILSVLKQSQNSHKLFEEWGLGETIEYGRGMTMMFWGGPGTGKTFGAHCIAKALGTTLLVVSAAEIQSSEPGAANRNIQKAFKSAKEDGKVLFLDECDSLITTRADLGMVLASEVNTLLTEIEKFEGVCILATNRIETMDEALERRLALIVEFPFPKYAQRIEIWKTLLPSKMPLEFGTKAETLAQDKLTGGQIKNVILQAARMAVADEALEVTPAHFATALTRLKKSKGLMGRLARSRTGRPMQDVQIGTDVGMDANLDSFLSTDEDND